MAAYKPPTSRYAAVTSEPPFSPSSSGSSLPSAFSSHRSGGSGSNNQIPSAFSKSRDRSGQKDGAEWSAFGAKKAASSESTQSANDTTSVKAAFVPKNSIFAHIEAAMGGSIPESPKESSTKWGQSALKKMAQPESEPVESPKKTFEDEFPSLAPSSSSNSLSKKSWGGSNNSLAERMREKIQKEEEDRKQKEFDEQQRISNTHKNSGYRSGGAIGMVVTNIYGKINHDEYNYDEDENDYDDGY